MPQLYAESHAAYLRTFLSAASAQLEHAAITIDSCYALLLEIKYDGRIFRLNAPLYLSRYAENGYIYLESKLLSIIAYGSSVQAAVESFQEDFAALWDAIAECSDDNLSMEAKKVKAELRRIVNAVVLE